MKIRTDGPWQHGDFEVEIGIGGANQGKVKSRRITLAKLAERLSNPVRDSITHAQYLKLPIEERHRRKNLGFWVGGPFVDGSRKNTSLKRRDVLTLDLDAVNSELIDDLKSGKSRLCRFCFFVHSTRNHTPEKPRVRIAIILKEPTTPEKYGPLSRIVAEMLDPTLDQIDDVSFRPTQIMYDPTVSKDGEFLFWQNEGELLDADAVLDAWGDWQDWTKLPFSLSQGQKRPVDPSRKAQHPHEKNGVVGAFCRTYSIEDAIEKFLPDVYAPGDANSGKPRYTYLGGSTTNGAVIEDDGLFLYSHHTTDPCTDRLVNAFDLVRIHLFGDADDGKDPNTVKTVDMPSYKSMLAFLEDDEPTRRELRDSRYDFASMFEDISDGDDEPRPSKDRSKKADDEEADAGANVQDVVAAFQNLDDLDLDDDIADLIGDVPAKAAPDTSWLEELELTPKGAIKSNLPNVVAILQNDPRLSGVIAFNEFTNETACRKSLVTKMKSMAAPVVQDDVNGDLWTDAHDNAVRLLLEAPNGQRKPGYGLRVSERDLKAAVDIAGRKNAFHPVRDYLDSLRWDGRPRVDRLFVKYLGAPDTPYTREIARKWLVAGVARIYEPGHKFDFMLVLEGKQGRRKTTFVRVLAKEWYGELEGDLHNRNRLVEQMQGAWLIEHGELSGMSRSDVKDIKAFVSAQSDKVRLAYARRAYDYKRQCVFCGTTNERQYLLDDTGGRRFWMIHVEVETIDTDALAAEVDQIWAEAVHLYREMRKKQPRGTLPLYLTNEESQREALEKQESRRVQTEIDVYAGVIQQWLAEPVPVSRIEGSKFSNLDGESKVLRMSVCLPEIWEQCFGNDIRQYKRSDALALGRAVRLVPGWGLNEKVVRTHKYGPQKVWRRIGAEGAIEDDDLIG